MEERETELIREAVWGIEKVLDEYQNYIENPEAIRKIKSHVIDIRKSTLNSYILERVGSVELNSNILFSAKRHLKYPDSRELIIKSCKSIINHLSWQKREEHKETDV